MRTGGPNFSKGEISEDLLGRVDVATYATGLRRARNVIGLKYGGVTKRPGTRLVAEVYDASQPVRLMPFQFSLEQTYVLEMGQGYMRPAANGGLVLEDRLTITAITLGTTTRITAAFHAYEVGDQVYFQDIAGTVELNGRIGRVSSVPNANQFFVDINSSGFSAFTADSGGVTRSIAPPPPPAPPPVPPPPTPTPPPDTGGGGYGGGYCVVDDAPILMADGSTCWGAYLTEGMIVRTQHETSLEWGDYPIQAIERAFLPVFRADGLPRATADHRFWIDGAWVRMRDLGEADGSAWVVKLTVRSAHTYVTVDAKGRHILSHNLKPIEDIP